jgi:predicted permease
MLLFTIPGFLLVKFKAVDSSHIKSFSKVLMIVCQPFLTFYSFQKVSYSNNNSILIGLTFLMSLILMLLIMLIMYLILRKRFSNVANRVICVCAAFGNVAFLGVPIIEAVLPDFKEGAMICATFVTTMNILGWTLGSYIITQDKKYVSFKKIMFNPATIGFIISLIFYFCDFHLASIPFVGDTLDWVIMILAKMSTALCMMILDMRLATIKLKPLFTNYQNYLAVLNKQIIVPFIVFGILYAIPLDSNFKITFVILSGAPIAAVVQNFTEMINQGQENAADMVILGTVLSVITVPLITLVL